jgi:hypothetical protein
VVSYDKYSLPIPSAIEAAKGFGTFASNTVLPPYGALKHISSIIMGSSGDTIFAENNFGLSCSSTDTTLKRKKGSLQI